MGRNERTGALTGRDLGLAVVAAAGLAAVYFAFRTQIHGYDAVCYATVADVPAAGDIFHSNHPLFTPLLWVVIRALRSLGYTGSSITPPAAVSAILAGAASGAVYLALRRLGARLAPAALAAAAASFSAAWWYFAGEAEVISCISFFLAGALLLLANRSSASGRAASVACWLAVGTWFHITLVLFVPVAAAVLAADREGRGRRGVAFFAVYGVLAPVPYIVISQWFYGYAGLKGFISWVNFYEVAYDHWGVWAGSMFLAGFAKMLVAAVAARRDLYAGIAGLEARTAVLKLTPAAVFVGAGIATIVAALPRLWKEKRRWVVAGAAWFAGYQLFFSWWDCGNPEWWVATTLPLWFLFGLAAPARRSFVIPAAAVVLAAGSVNFARVILPASRPGQNPYEKAARILAEITDPGDTLWVPDSSVSVWVKNLTRNDRFLMETGEGVKPGCYNGYAISLADPASPEPRDGTDIYFTDYELDNERALGRGPEAAAARAALFTIIRKAEPVAVLPFPYTWPVLFRHRPGIRPYEDVRIYEAEKEGDLREYAFLWSRGGTVKFVFDVPRDGRYVLCVQARGGEVAEICPRMQLIVDGRWAAFTPADTSWWRFYETTIDFAPGRHVAEVKLSNPRTVGPGPARKLFVNRLIVYRASE